MERKPPEHPADGGTPEYWRERANDIYMATIQDCHMHGLPVLPTDWGDALRQMREERRAAGYKPRRAPRSEEKREEYAERARKKYAEDETAANLQRLRSRRSNAKRRGNEELVAKLDDEIQAAVWSRTDGYIQESMEAGRDYAAAVKHVDWWERRWGGRPRKDQSEEMAFRRGWDDKAREDRVGRTFKTGQQEDGEAYKAGWDLRVGGAGAPDHWEAYRAWAMGRETE